jgi:hypothetical protein
MMRFRWWFVLYWLKFLGAVGSIGILWLIARLESIYISLANKRLGMRRMRSSRVVDVLILLLNLCTKDLQGKTWAKISCHKRISKWFPIVGRRKHWTKNSKSQHSVGHRRTEFSSGSKFFLYQLIRRIGLYRLLRFLSLILLLYITTWTQVVSAVAARPKTS